MHGSLTPSFPHRSSARVPPPPRRCRGSSPPHIGWLRHLPFGRRRGEDDRAPFGLVRSARALVQPLHQQLDRTARRADRGEVGSLRRWLHRNVVGRDQVSQVCAVTYGSTDRQPGTPGQAGMSETRRLIRHSIESRRWRSCVSHPSRLSHGLSPLSSVNDTLRTATPYSTPLALHTPPTLPARVSVCRMECQC